MTEKVLTKASSGFNLAVLTDRVFTFGGHSSESFEGKIICWPTANMTGCCLGLLISETGTEK